MKNIAKSIFLTGARMLRPKLSGVSILMYHSAGNDKAFFTVRPGEFRKQMELIKKSGYPVRRLRDVVEDLENSRQLTPAIVITFDDGYENNVTEALPILKEFSFPATIFVATAFIGLSRKNSEGIALPMMGETQLRESVASGLITIESHGHNHIDFSKASLEEVRKDIATSVQLIKGYSSISEPILAYPWGHYTAQTPIVAQAAGCAAAVTVREGIVRANDPLFELKRNSVDSSTTIAQFRAKICDAVEVYTRFKKR